MILLNALARGEDEYDDLTPFERLYLIAGLSCKDRHRTTLAKTERWLPGLGRDRQEAVRRGLREKGYLSMRRRWRGPENSARGSQFEGWTMRFMAEALPPDQRDELQPKTGRRRSGEEPAGDSTPGSSGHADGTTDNSESAGHRMPGHPGHANPGHANPGPEPQGVTPYIEKEPREKNPPTPTEITASADVVPAEGGKADSKDTKELTLAMVVDWFVQRRPDWTRQAVEDALSTAQTRGLGDLARCATALRELVEGKHGRTDYPGRLLVTSGGWWTAVAPQPRPRPTGPKCQVPGHHAQAAVDCKLCDMAAKANALARDDDDALVMDPDAAIERGLQYLPENVRRRREERGRTPASAVL